MAKRIVSTTPKQDGYYMPGEYAPQKGVFMLWPERKDNWRDGARPAQLAYARVAEAIAGFEPVTVGVNAAQYAGARAMLPASVRVVEIPNDDAWMRDTGPSFVIDGKGGLRAVDWTFNAWGGLYDGLYFPWDRDDRVAQAVCELENIDSYRAEGFVLEGGAFHVDGEGTVLTTEMCLLSPGRNPHLSKAEIERKLCEYLGAETVIWLPEGMDPGETNGHVDNVACFVRPGEAACIFTDDPAHPFFSAAQSAYHALQNARDARGRRLKVHKVCLPRDAVRLAGAETIGRAERSIPRNDGDICIASYINFLIVNGGVIVPQYGDAHDFKALAQIQSLFPDRRAVGVDTREIVYGGGNIHCITQQLPAV